ncbi:alpha/beta hydrolase [Staphylococcus sp. NRL 16/872]|uniref:RBBP9/YdeN family alpha/beta hydrolase n=1 Tax=Staphylococcus sp. NRL 16/872 TaxID=2930131 RepID=UPI001FB252DB|nr:MULTISPECIES: alpha/beta hydrolase [unclassified Staphylococcus]MCJ1656064.1 alpha/beta hydrolase [Staphylococcus sp. NRL 21/187]MCJ1661851.1 alpha/beta hydrolase [Staphylococcus sp. NRL 18/288]WEN70302.1 alpha/beta hydrolase [Staphylococcus sp. NRL 16/872]
MTNVIIVHSCLGDSHNHWYEWLQHNLKLEGYDVQLFNIDKDNNHNIDKWVTAMNKQIIISSSDTYFVTHGFGSIAALKYIEDLDINKPLAGFFSIAGFKEDAKDIDENINIDPIDIDYSKIKSKIKHFYGLASKTDQYVSYKETEKLLKTLGGHIRIVEEGGHFLEEEGFVSFTELQERMQMYMTK